MLHKTLAVLAIAGLTGCASDGGFAGFGDSRERTEQRAQMAAFAASEENQYPDNVNVSEDLAVAGIVNQKDNTIRIFNFSDQTLRNAKLWINQSFVYRIDNVPANSSTRVPFSGLYNSDGRTFTDVRAPITSIQLQVDDTMYRVQGPAYE